MICGLGKSNYVSRLAHYWSSQFSLFGWRLLFGQRRYSRKVVGSVVYLGCIRIYQRRAKKMNDPTAQAIINTAGKKGSGR